MRRLSVLVSVAALAVAAAPAEAAAATPRCGTQLPITRQLLRKIERYTTVSRSRQDAVLAATLRTGEGVIAFVRTSGRWRAYRVADGAGLERTYRSPRGDVFLWAYNGLGDPPTAFTGMFVPADGKAPRYCTSFEVPNALNKPDWKGEAFHFDLFNISNNGRAVVVGSADVERGGRQQHWTFRYSSRDYGRRWSSPVRISPVRRLLGVYSQVQGESASLIRDLRRSSR